MSAIGLPWRALRLFFRRHGSSYAAALAYRALFSFAPLLVVAVAIAGLVLGPEAAETRVLATIRAEMGPAMADLAGLALESLRTPGRNALATTVAGLLALYGAVRVVGELRRALTALWRQENAPRRRRGILGAAFNQLLGVAFVLGGGLLLGASLVATTVLGALASRAPSGLADVPIDRLTAEGVALLATTVLFGLLFTYLPEHDLPARITWIGALFTALLFTAGKLAVDKYLRFAGVGSAYGAAGSLVALLAWVHYTSVILLYGATLTQVWREERGRV